MKINSALTPLYLLSKQQAERAVVPLLESGSGAAAVLGLLILPRQSLTPGLLVLTT